MPTPIRSLPIARRLALGITAALLMGPLTAPAAATWSIVIADTRTGEVVAASATCLLGFDLRDNTPVILQGIGAATAQSAVDQTAQNRTRIRDGLAAGLSLPEVLANLEQFDSGHQSRQYGMVTTTGEALTFSGANASAYAGGVTGSFGDVVYAIQGNILTGDPVVFEAELAILDYLAETERDGTLDLPGAMMAGMEAARAFGGDGRCSCDAGPTDCGSPPEGPFVSAYIAYAIVARAGDRDICNAAYPGPPNPGAIATGDFNQDGLEDIVIASTSGFTGFGILLNDTQDGLPPTFVAGQSISTNDQIRDVEVVDLNGNGMLDLLGPSDRTGGVVVAYATGPGEFGSPVTFGAGAPNTNRGRTIAVGDFDGINGPDAAVTDGRADRIRVFFNDGTGALVEGAPVGLGFRYRDLRAADLTGDGLTDLAVASDVSNRVFIYAGDGNGAFATALDLPVTGAPTSLAVGDLDADGRTDLVVGAANSTLLTIVRRDDLGAFFTDTHDLGFTPDGIAPGAFNDDETDDFVVFGGTNGSVGTSLLGRPAALPVQAGLADLGNGTSEAALADFGDGPRAVFASSGAGGLLVTETRQNAGMVAAEGCGNGDYYLSLNISGGNPNAPDPVFQLQDLFDAEREALRGVTDAARTVVLVPQLPVTPTDGATIEILPRDWNSDPAGISNLTYAIEPGPGITGLSFQATEHPDGTATLQINADPASSGEVTVSLWAFDLAERSRFIPLPPEVTFTFRPALLDFDTNGVVNIFDLIEFLRLVAVQDPRADLTSDGAVDVLDIVEFLSQFSAT